jgi:hypothetical protein
MKKSFGANSAQHLVQNVELVVRNKDGEVKNLWSNNKFGDFLLRIFRRLFVNNHLAIYGVRVPFLTGVWNNKLYFHNLITNAGMAGAASRVNGSGGEAAFTYIGVGTGTTAANVANTAIQTESTGSGLARAAATASRVTTDVTNDTARLNKQFSVTGTVAVTESGVLNASSSGTLLARQVFSAVNVVNGDTLDVTWDFDID